MKKAVFSKNYIHFSVSHPWAATCSAVSIGQSNVELHVYVCYLMENVAYTKSKMCFVKHRCPCWTQNPKIW